MCSEVTASSTYHLPYVISSLDCSGNRYAWLGQDFLLRKGREGGRGEGIRIGHCTLSWCTKKLPGPQHISSEGSVDYSICSFKSFIRYSQFLSFFFYSELLTKAFIFHGLNSPFFLKDRTRLWTDTMNKGTNTAVLTFVTGKKCISMINCCTNCDKNKLMQFNCHSRYC